MSLGGDNVPIFKYKAIKQNGENFSGEMSMPTEDEVRGYLKEKDYFIVMLL